MLFAVGVKAVLAPETTPFLIVVKGESGQAVSTENGFFSRMIGCLKGMTFKFIVAEVASVIALARLAQEGYYIKFSMIVATTSCHV